MPGFDLHTHTVHSDGTTTVAENVRAALDAGLEGLAVTDHDTTSPFEEAAAAADGTGLEVIPGVEFSAEHDGSSVHVLGYWVDPGDEPLQDEMDRLRNERERRAEAIVEKFVALGVPVTIARVRELAGEAPLARPHIARAVVETGAVESIQAVFDDYLADGGPAYVPKHAVDPVRAVELLVAAGAAVVCAHPGLYGARSQDEPGLPVDVVEAMAAAGMVGLEADHPDHTAENRALYRAVAQRLDLVVTAGSDFHGEARDHDLGEVSTPRAVVEELRRRR